MIVVNFFKNYSWDWSFETNDSWEKL